MQSMPDKTDGDFKVLGTVVKRIPVFCLTQRGPITHLYKCTVTARTRHGIRSLGCIYRRIDNKARAKDVKKILKPYLERMLKENKNFV